MAQVLLVDDRRVFVQVADVVEQGGDHQAVGAARPFGQGRALQGMLRLADGLAVGFRAVAGEAFGQFVEEEVAGVFHGDSPCGRGWECRLIRASLADARDTQVTCHPGRYNPAV
ncbi:hypothetical protein D9M73_281440 [compost metagenome]